ncbi:MAG TPA: hypothetical protein VMF30_05610 [Pirellulales bacterium]|nr:hypothetical protein [Pirellulales bacterium]
MASVYSVTFAVLGLVVMYSSLLVWTALILPAPVSRARARLEARPVASFFAGLVVFLLTVLLYVGFLLIRGRWLAFVDDALNDLASRLQYGRFYNDAYKISNGFAWLLAAPAMIGWIVGGAGFAQLFATRARALMHEDRPLLALALGALTQSFAFFLPALGWFLFLPVITCMSIGAGLLAVVQPHAPIGLHAGKSGGSKDPATRESELASP